MLFNSLAFMIFLPVVFVLYWGIPHKYRWILLLFSSYYFYMSWNIKYIMLIFLTSFISYTASILIEKKNIIIKRLILCGAIFLCLGVLFFFKYFTFLGNSLIQCLSIFSIHLHPITLKLVLPVGISFYTFQTLSYVIDVYRGDINAEYHFGKYAAFISFFPQLVAGPIERSKNLLPQIKKEHNFNSQQALYGLKLILWGLFKKVVVADNLAVYVDRVYNNIFEFKGFSLILVTLFFSVQIYCDFSGYSDIARGTAKLMGIELLENFKSPYFSASIKEFWNRWHISLSTWFRDYVYIPLGGNRVSKVRHHLNILITFLVSGLWHGANWTFIVWGGVHGAAQVVENLFGVHINEKRGSIVWGVKVILVFTFISVSWIFFRSKNLTEVAYIFSNLFYGLNNPITYLHSGFVDLQMNIGQAITYVCLYFFPLFLYDYISVMKDEDTIKYMEEKYLIFRWTIYIFIGLTIIFLSPKGVATEFVYFQF